MNIVHIVPSAGWAGSEKIAFSFAIHQAFNHKVAVVVKTGPGFSAGFYRDKLPANVNLIVINSSLKTQQEINGFVKASLDFVPDIIHAHLSLGCRIAKSLRSPGNVLIGHMHIRFFAVQFKEMDAVVAVSPWQLDDVPSWYQGKKKLICNFISNNWPKTVVDIVRFRKRFYIEESDYIIGTVSRLHIEKGIDTLIKAFIKSDLKNAKLVIVGDGPDAEKLRIMAGGRDNIIFTRFLDNAAQYMAAFDLYVSTSRADSFGLSVLEAVSQEVPVLASATYGSKDIFGESAQLFEIDDYVTLAEKLKDAWNQKLRNTVSIDAFNEKSSNVELISFYDEILGEKFSISTENCPLVA